MTTLRKLIHLQWLFFWLIHSQISWLIIYLCSSRLQNHSACAGIDPSLSLLYRSWSLFLPLRVLSCLLLFCPGVSIKSDYENMSASTLRVRVHPPTSYVIRVFKNKLVRRARTFWCTALQKWWKEALFSSAFQMRDWQKLTDAKDGEGREANGDGWKKIEWEWGSKSEQKTVSISRNWGSIESFFSQRNFFPWPLDSSVISPSHVDAP